jgi:hypothetical protein
MVFLEARFPHSAAKNHRKHGTVTKKNKMCLESKCPILAVMDHGNHCAVFKSPHAWIERDCQGLRGVDSRQDRIEVLLMCC